MNTNTLQEIEKIATFVADQKAARAETLQKIAVRKRCLNDINIALQRLREKRESVLKRISDHEKNHEKRARYFSREIESLNLSADHRDRCITSAEQQLADASIKLAQELLGESFFVIRW